MLGVSGDTSALFGVGVESIASSTRQSPNALEGARCVKTSLSVQTVVHQQKTLIDIFKIG